MSLRAYIRKRDFTRTAEPRGKTPAKEAGYRYVIQKHDASRLHYDFRLELGGTLKSWAVPKGIPYQKGEKHLAVQVEDHPLEYAGFEGVIPKGQYGGGTVMLWDRGTFLPLGSDNPAKDVEEGKFHFELHGEKLDGEWTLVRIKGSDNEWLLLKSGEDVKPVSKKNDDLSALSGRTLARIARDRSAEWRADGEAEAVELNFIAPMKATLVETPPQDDGWLYELKFDGYRALALKSGSEVQLLSSNAKDFTSRFSEITDAIARLPCDSAVLDGEVVALDQEGRSSFQLLQQSETEHPPLAFYVFDLLHSDGDDLLAEPLHERRRGLQALLRKGHEPLRFSDEISGDPKRLLEEVRKRGLEGIIGKQRDSSYEPGRRSRAWIKLKCVDEQEFVIGGYTPPEGTRQHFGALLVGYYHADKLHFAGKVGSGFDTAMLKALYKQMHKAERKTCPFANLPEKRQGRWSQNITPREMKLCHWVEPELVCQLRFSEWTNDGKLRHPVFLGLREDKSAREVTRERPTKVSP